MTVSPTAMEPVVGAVRLYADTLKFAQCDLPPDTLRVAISLCNHAHRALQVAHAGLLRYAEGIKEPDV